MVAGEPTDRCIRPPVAQADKCKVCGHGGRVLGLPGPNVSALPFGMEDCAL